jgi:hypothetical protein
MGQLKISRLRDVVSLYRTAHNEVGTNNFGPSRHACGVFTKKRNVPVPHSRSLPADLGRFLKSITAPLAMRH